MSHPPRGREVGLTKALTLEHARCGIIVKGVAVVVMRPADRGMPVGM